MSSSNSHIAKVHWPCSNKLITEIPAMNTLLNKIYDVDVNLFLWINIKSQNHYYHLIRSISHTGDGPLYFIITMLIFACDKQLGYQFLLTALIAYLIEVPSYLLLKNTIKRNRPAEKLVDFKAKITPSDAFSFPSGHTAAAFVFALMISNFYPVFSLIAFIWASMIGFSRVLLGVHFPGDIIAGIFIGILSFLFANQLGQFFLFT